MKVVLKIGIKFSFTVLYAVIFSLTIIITRTKMICRTKTKLKLK